METDSKQASDLAEVIREVSDLSVRLAKIQSGLGAVWCGLMEEAAERKRTNGHPHTCACGRCRGKSVDALLKQTERAADALMGSPHSGTTT